MENKQEDKSMSQVQKNLNRIKNTLKIDGLLLIISFIFTYIFVISLYINAGNSSDPSAFSALGFVFILTVPLSSIFVLWVISKLLIDLLLYRYESMCLERFKKQSDTNFTFIEYNRSKHLRLFLYRFTISLIMFGSIYLLPNIIFLLVGVDITVLMLFISVGFILPGIFHLIGSFNSYKRYSS